jgi:hypothetical protein
VLTEQVLCVAASGRRRLDRDCTHQLPVRQASGKPPAKPDGRVRLAAEEELLETMRLQRCFVFRKVNLYRMQLATFQLQFRFFLNYKEKELLHHQQF